MNVSEIRSALHRVVLRWGTLLAVTPLCFAAMAQAQAVYTASRTGELQVGGTATFAVSHYLPYNVQGNSAPLSDLTRQVHLVGGGAYASYDTNRHVGVELDFHHLSAVNDTSAQTTVQAAGRYLLFRRPRLVPYLRASVGYGSYSYPQGSATLGYLLFGFGGGLDVHLTRSINARVAYEYESWLNVPLKNPQPQAVSLGLAYRF